MYCTTPALGVTSITVMYFIKRAQSGWFYSGLGLCNGNEDSTHLLPLGLALPQPGLIQPRLLRLHRNRRSFTALALQMKKKRAAFSLLSYGLGGDVTHGLAPVGLRNAESNFMINWQLLNNNKQEGCNEQKQDTDSFQHLFKHRVRTVLVEAFNVGLPFSS